MALSGNHELAYKYRHAIGGHCGLCTAGCVECSEFTTAAKCTKAGNGCIKNTDTTEFEVAFCGAATDKMAGCTTCLTKATGDPAETCLACA
jgi:hypothetical protein